MNQKLNVWGQIIELRDFAEQEVAEVKDTFAGAVSSAAAQAAPDLTLRRERAQVRIEPAVTRPRHRGGSTARKFFIDGSAFDGTLPYRDIGVITESADFDAYATDDALVVTQGGRATIVAAEAAPPMLVADVVEDWLLCAARNSASVQVHCAGWVDEGRATLLIGSSGVGKTTELFRHLQGGSRFLSNDRAFLRIRDGRPEVRSFPLPVNVGCGTIRSLGLHLPDHELGDHDKIRLRPPEVAERFGAIYDSWYPVSAIVCSSRADLAENVYWTEDSCHPFWVGQWRPERFAATFVSELSAAIEDLMIVRAPVLT